MSKTTIVIAVVTVIVMAATIVASFNIEGVAKLLPNLKLIPPSKQTSLPKAKKPSLSLPITATSSAVKSATVTYTFEGVLKEVKTNYQGSSRSAELITNIKTKNLKGFKGKKVPRFITTKKTKYVFLEKGKEKRAKFQNLQAGKKIRITAQYNLIKKKWSVQKVAILVPTQKASLLLK